LSIVDRLFRWEEVSPDAARRRELKRRLADAVRQVVEDVALVDATAVATDDDLERLIAAAKQLSAQLAAAPSHRAKGGLNYEGSDWEGALVERSPISGHSNPLAGPLVVDPVGDDDVVRAHAPFGYAYEGPPGHLHGGAVAGAFDEMVGIGQAVSGRAGFTGVLPIQMRRPTPLHTRIDYEAGVTKVDGRKISVWSTATANGELVGEAEALMITPRTPLY
jgi:hypothetical protein